MVVVLGGLWLLVSDVGQGLLLLSVVCHTVFSFSKLEVVVCKKVSRNQEMLPRGGSVLMTLLLLCEAAAISLRLFMVCWPGARLQLLLSLEVA